MVIFGKPLSAYVSFAKLFLTLVLIAGVVRLTLSLEGVPNSSTRWISMTALVWISVFYYGIRMYSTGFGSYKQLLVVFALIDWVTQAVSITGISIAIATGVNNVFSSPEFAFGGDGKTWLHLAAHLFVGTTVGALVPWAFSSGIFALTKKFSTKRSLDAASVRL
jgi:hypothetical protein